MSFRSRLIALLVGASAPVRDSRRPRAATVISDGLVSPAREAKLIEDGRKVVDDIIARSRVERTGHFDAPRFSA